MGAEDSKGSWKDAGTAKGLGQGWQVRVCVCVQGRGREPTLREHLGWISLWENRFFLRSCSILAENALAVHVPAGTAGQRCRCLGEHETRRGQPCRYGRASVGEGAWPKPGSHPTISHCSAWSHLSSFSSQLTEINKQQLLQLLQVFYSQRAYCIQPIATVIWIHSFYSREGDAQNKYNDQLR